MTPALALIDELASDSSVEVIVIGRKYAQEGDTQESAEFTLVMQKGLRFLPITAGRLQRAISPYTLTSLAKIPVGIVQAFTYCIRERPSIVVSFGGYVALPVAVAAWVLGIPVITHEQTLTTGLTNRIIGQIAKRICVTFKETVHLFPKEKVVVTGLPLRKELFRATERTPYLVDRAYPILYITGGTTGARSLNEHIYPTLKNILNEYTVIHQTGSVSLPRAETVRDGLPKSLRSRYIVEPYVISDKLAWIMKHAMIVIARSGANTTLELASLGKVAILIPLPWSAGGEQRLHAQWLARQGGAIVMHQNTLTSDSLTGQIKEIRVSYASLLARAKRFSHEIPTDGARNLAKEVRAFLPDV